jgi:outer membrane protein
VKKYLFLFSTLIFSCGVILGQGATANQKVGYVDSQVILAQLPEAIKAQGQLDALTNQWTAQLDSMNKDLQQSYEDYQKQAATMTDAKKTAAQQNLVEKQQTMESFRKEKFAQQTGEIYKKNDEIFAPIKKKIFNAIEDVAKKEGMKFVFDKAGDVVLLYADPAFDITYQVLDNLKRGVVK